MSNQADIKGGEPIIEGEVVPTEPGTIPVVVRLEKYNPVKAEIAALQQLNSSLVFDYRTPDGNKNARSHIFKIRETKANVERVRKAEKAYIIEAGKQLNSVAKALTATLDRMIDVHMEPIKAIEDEQERKIKEAEERAAAEAAEAERLRQAEVSRLLDEAIANSEAARQRAQGLQDQLDATMLREANEKIKRDAEEKARVEAEAESRRLQDEAIQKKEQAAQALLDEERAKFQAERDEFNRQKKAAEDAKAAAEKAELDRIEAEAQAERDRIAAIEKADADKKAAVEKAIAEEREKERLAKEAEELKMKQEAEAEAARLKEKKVRLAAVKKLSASIYKQISTLNDDQCYAVGAAIYDGNISNVHYKE